MTGKQFLGRNNFLKKLVLHKLIRKEEMVEIPKNILIFPMDVENAMMTICRHA
jgi:uncharacterized protein YrrD